VSVYVDSSALMKRYLDESDRERYTQALDADPDWISARHTSVEVRRTLARALSGGDLALMRSRFEEDWADMQIVELDESTCAIAGDVAEATGARTLDALHLAAAQRVGGGQLTLVTADLRQAQIARSLGWPVFGA
jgi:uncharacterized protein